LDVNYYNRGKKEASVARSVFSCPGKALSDDCDIDALREQCEIESEVHNNKQVTGEERRVRETKVYLPLRGRTTGALDAHKARIAQ